MLVSEMEVDLCCGDVIIQRVDTNILTGEPMVPALLFEMVVIWARKEFQHGKNEESDDFDVVLMWDTGEVWHVKNASTLDNCEYSHHAFKFGARKENG